MRRISIRLIAAAILIGTIADRLELIRVAEADGRLRRMASIEYPFSVLDRLSQFLGIVGFALLIRRGSA
jgi:hypothetical protein